MNELSWLLYAADVAGSLGAATGFWSVVGGAAGLFLLLIGLDSDVPQKASTMGKTLLVSAGLAGAISILAPSSDTLYAIAASEVGEEVLKSETTEKALDALNAWLDRQLEPPENNP